MGRASVLLPAFTFLADVWAAPGVWPQGTWYGPPHDPHAPQAWSLKNFTTLVAFGDSYTDDNRLNYFISHQGQAPPVGWVDPPNYAAADGGRPWPEYVKQYTGANLYNYAVSGAVCSNDITPRSVGFIDILYPAVEQYEVPAYIADSQYVEPNGTKFMIAPQDETVYSIWIGTNDLGVNALLTDSQVQGTTIVNYTDCVFRSLQAVYNNGGRYFIIQNVAPLNLAPLYALPGKGGVAANQYWPDKPSNLTEISYRMLEQVATVNAIYRYQTPYAVEVAKSFPGAQFAVMDVHGLMTDIYNNPAQYLNGTAPLNVTGSVRDCSGGPAVCDPDSFMWFDELHPSQQTERVVAREFVNVVKGQSRWATYWSS